MKSKTKTAKNRTPKAPPIIHVVVDALTRPASGIVDDAYAEATRILANGSHVSDEAIGKISDWVENSSSAYLLETAPKLLQGDWIREAGAMQVAFQDPSFALAFCLAYQMLMKGGEQ